MLKRKVSPIKRPSMTKVGTKPSTLSQRNAFTTSRGDTSLPKIRFSLNDRSSSSPRLKSFPAEKIKRLDPPPIQKFPGNVDGPRPMQNSGQGDTLQPPAVQFQPVVRSVPMTNQNISSISEQQVPRPIYPASNQVNQSEHAIPSMMEHSSMERPVHRPFVPNAPQANSILRDRSPRKTMSPRLYGPPQTSNRAEPESVEQPRDPWKIENDSLKPSDPEKEPVGGKYAALHRRNVEAHRNHQIQSQRSPIGGPNISNLSSVADPAGWHEPQQMYHRHQPTLHQYCHQSGQMGTPMTRINETHAGMTSPQDIAVNQIQNHQRMMQCGSYGWSPVNQPNPWIPNQRAQIQPYSMDIVTPGINVNPDSGMRYQYMQHAVQSPHSHQPMSVNWQTHNPQQQRYCHQGHISSVGQPQTVNSAKAPGLENHRKEGGTERKPLRFTPSMIRDQELLVTTMRQQGIPEDIMRRQFEALLAEQRKQLLYLEQLERGGDANGTDKLQQRRRVQRKISRIDEDGKPEWMLHITPPRIPYGTIEKMRHEREVDRQQTTGGNENCVRTGGLQDQRQNYDQTNHENYQQYRKMDGSANWQQNAPHSYDRNNLNAAMQHPNFEMSAGQAQMRYYGYPMQYQHQHQQQYPQQVQAKWPHHGQLGNTREEMQRNQRYEEPEKRIEPSSLLKLRLYREVVRKQKQNNGLQDPETVKEAMEALKNPANRKDLEYLENLNKKREKPMSLNGAQDPRENTTLGSEPQHRYISLNSQQAKMPSANGLENRRNPNNPPPTLNLRQRKLENPHFAEYPRQRSSSISQDCYSFTAERENGTVANSMAREYQQHQNSTMPSQMAAHQMHMQSMSENGFQLRGQLQQSDAHKDIKMTARSTSMPSAFNEQSRTQFCAAPMQQYYENRKKNGHVSGASSQPAMFRAPGFGRCLPDDGNAANLQQPQQQQSYYHCPYENNELHEAITIGGIKYLARKPDYIQNPSAPSLQRDQLNPGKYFNPMIPCQ